MRITIIGASTGVGLEAVKIALQRHHIVTTLSRSEIDLPPSPNLIIQKGSATNRVDLQKSLENADAIIVALGTGKNMKPTNLYSDFAKLLVDLQKEVKKEVPFIILTGFGAGDSWDYQPNFIMKLFFKYLLRDVYSDKTKMEEIISQTNLKWVIARPGLLKDKPLTGKYRVETTLFEGIKIGSINRADVADFLVKQAENPTQLYKYCSLSNL